MTRSVTDRRLGEDDDELTATKVWTKGPNRRTTGKKADKRNAWRRTLEHAVSNDGKTRSGAAKRTTLLMAGTAGAALGVGAAILLGLTWNEDYIALAVTALLAGGASAAATTRLNPSVARKAAALLAGAIAGLAFAETVSTDLLMVIGVGSLVTAITLASIQRLDRQRAHRRHIAAAFDGTDLDDDEEDEARGTMTDAGSFSRFQRISTLILVAVITVVAGTVAYLAYTNHALQDRIDTLLTNATEQAIPAPLPDGPAEMCTTLVIEGGATAESVAATNAACGTDYTVQTFSGQTAKATDVSTATALGRPLSYATDTPGVYSMLVAVELVTITTDDTGLNPVPTSQGVHYFRTTIGLKPSGKYAMLSLPREVAVPVDNAPARPEMTLTDASLDDPRTSVLQEYLTRFYLNPPPDNPGAGSVANYTESGSAGLTLHSPNIQEVTVRQTSYSEPDDDGYTTANALMAVIYQGGAVSTQMVTLSITDNTGRWLISDRPPTTTYGN